MEPASQLSKVVFQIVFRITNILALLPMLAGMGLAQSEPAKPPAASPERCDLFNTRFS